MGVGLYQYSTLTVMQLYVKKEDMAAVTAFYLLIYYFGLGVRSSISGAVRTQVMDRELIKHMDDPKEALQAYPLPFNYIKTQPWGDPMRQKMVDAYDHVQWVLCVVGVCLMAPMFIAALVIKDRYLLSKGGYEDDDSIEDEKHKLERPSILNRLPFVKRKEKETPAHFNEPISDPSLDHHLDEDVSLEK